MVTNSHNAGVPQKPAQVLIVDDQPLVCFGFRRLLDQMPEVQVCGEALSHSEALDLVKTRVPDLVTLEITSSQSGGLNFIREVRLTHPQVLLLVITSHEDALYAERSFRAGASGFINKREALANLIKAVKTVLCGKIYVSEKITSRLVSKIAGRIDGESSITEMLTDRELQVFELIGEGFGPKQIGLRLKIDKSTVETYRSRIKKKLQFNNAADLRKKAIEWNHGRNR